ncbi:MAG: hypothetical protein IJN54_16445 [Lachnospiraceae bacterium]|nr:hypothetical protein [Lachnospiraceae bacterium]
MINLVFREFTPLKSVEKNILYKVDKDVIVKFIEQHEVTKEIVNVYFGLKDGQYGIYANEYRRPGTQKEGCKTTDVLSCVVDEQKKEIKSLIFDVKSNISAFSDDLSKTEAMITAIKEVRDFIEQIRAELLHKDSFLLYYKADGYVEEERVGIVTKSFESEKFKRVAEKLERMVTEEDTDVPTLVSYKLKNNIRAYRTEIEPLYNFADKKIVLNKTTYQLKVFVLQKINDTDYEITIKMANE